MRRALPALLLAVLTAACTPATTGSPAPATDTPSASPTAAQWPADWTLPRSDLTPGAIGTTDVTRLCPHVDPALEAARPAAAEKAANYKAYGLTYPQPPGKYEDDHLVPIELGGAPDDQRNLWPQLNDTPDAAAIKREGLNAAFVHNSKDILEDVLHRDVCDGTVPLSIAQQAIASDWRQAYTTYVGPAAH